MGVAGVAVVLSVAGRWALDPLVRDQFPFLIFLVAVGLATWFGGRWAGVITLLACGAATIYIFLPPRHSWIINGSGAIPGILIYLVGGGVLVAVFESRRQAWLRAMGHAELLQVTLGSIDDGVITTDARDLVTHLNPAAERMTGWRCEEAEGHPLDEVMWVVDGTTRKRARDRTGKTGEPALLIHHEGGERWIESHATALPSSGGPPGRVTVFRDVTERYLAQREAEASLAKVQMVADAVPALISYISADCRYQLNNRTYETWFDLPRSEIHGHTLEEVMGPQAWQSVRSHVAAALRGEPVSYEAEVPHHDGSTRWIAASYTPDVGDEGAVRGFVAHVHDVTERKRAEEALRKSEEKLREADRRKDEFLATLAHELRNPLAPVRHALAILKRHGNDGDLADKARATLERQIAHMVRLVDDLLDVSRINSGRLELRREWTDLREVVQHSAEASRPSFEERRLRFELSLPEAPVWVEADPIRLTQVFGNLLHNAAKYTDPGGRIRLSMERDSDEVVVRITDTGIGIPREKLSRVFELFTQLDDSLEKSAGGLGIGLSLVKRLVEKHGGTVAVDSAGPGQGSEFVCRLPAPPHVAEVPAGEVAAPVTSASPRKILVADDNRDIAESLALLLKVEGHETRCVHNGRQAVEEAARFQPHVVILDIGMPGLNGLDACRAIRSAAGGQAMLIVALTGWGQNDDRQKTRDAGFDAHLVKPVDADELYRLLETAVPGSG